MVMQDAAPTNARVPPRQRLLAAATKLFYRHGIRAVGVDAIAEAAGTNKMTLYRHFSSKDELVAEYLRQAAEAVDATWTDLAHTLNTPWDPLHRSSSLAMPCGPISTRRS